MPLLWLTLTLLSQPLLEERFDAPLGSSWNLPPAVPTVRVGVTPAAAHWGASGAQFDKRDAGPGGVVSFDGLVAPLGNLAPELHVRLWFNLQEGTNTLRVSPIQLGQPIDSFTLGELYVDPGGSGAMLLSCAAQGFRLAPIPGVVVPGKWSLLELDLEGLGTNDGGCRGAVDGTEVSMSGFAWGARGASLLVTGLNVVSDAWLGTYAVDDLTLTRESFAMRTTLRGPQRLDAGSCGALQLGFAARDGGPLPPPTTARFLATVDGGALFSDANCSVALGAQQLTAAQAGGLFLTAAAPIASVSLISNDLLPSTLQVQLNPFDADMADAAVADSGPPADAGIDAGASAPLTATVGCGCSVSTAPCLAALFLALTWRRRARRPSR